MGLYPFFLLVAGLSGLDSDCSSHSFLDFWKPGVPSGNLDLVLIDCHLLGDLRQGLSPLNLFPHL